jgi:phospholipid/cholesterol/gamma-HCH transport system substrate-binding protein
MATKSQKVWIGVFAVLSTVLLAGVLVVFAGLQLWESRDRYRIVFEGSVYGLEDGAHVFLNGVRVGYVDDLGVAREDIRTVAITIAVDEGTPVHLDTRAMLQAAGVTGLKVIDLREGSQGSPRLPPGGTIPQGKTLLDKLEQRAEHIVDESAALLAKANRIVDNLIEITDASQFDGVAEIVSQTRTAADNLAAASLGLDRLVAENRVALRTSVASIDAAARSESELFAGRVPQFLDDANGVVLQLQGLVADNQATLRASVRDLRHATRTFKELAREVRQRPSRLLFSPPAPERKLP